MVDDPSQLRISDDDRHKVAELLRAAAGEGRLDFQELDERLEAAYGAKIYADLVPIVADLPGANTQTPVIRNAAQPARPAPNSPVRPDGTRVQAAHHTNSFVVMGGQDRRGVWEVGPTYNAFCLMGGIDLDLREAVFTAPEISIQANSIMGGIDITVNEWTQVIVDGFGIMGDFSELRPKAPADLGPGSPVVRVKGVALMGAVNVRRKPMPGQGRKNLRKLLH